MFYRAVKYANDSILLFELVTSYGDRFSFQTIPLSRTEIDCFLCLFTETFGCHLQLLLFLFVYVYQFL